MEFGIQMRKVISIFFLAILSAFAQADSVKNSIYVLKSQWQDQDGKALTLDRFKGKTTVITMVYTGCSYACPLTVKKLNELEKALAGKKDASKVQFVMASFDSVKDKPVQLKKYMKKHAIPSSHWTMLSAPKDSVARELAAVLGINYRAVGKSDFSHSNVITLLDAQGAIVTQLNGLNSDTAPFIEKMLATVK